MAQVVGYLSSFEKNSPQNVDPWCFVYREAKMSAGELTLIETEAGRITQAQSDARLSFDEAFAAHHRLVYRYAYAVTRDGALAEDVTQEVFLRLHSQLEQAQREGLLRPWLLRVTTNVARNLLRTRRRAAVRDEAFANEAQQRSVSITPDDELARQLEIARAQRALDKLKEPLRSCLLLRHEGLSYREIAAALGLKESSVGSLIVRGRNKFMKLYLKIGKER
jgi:RNA polymerase sigma factor (sigma-70 family)